MQGDTLEAQQTELQLGELIARVALRDRNAFKQLYDMSSGRSYGLALKMTGAKVAAQDVMQEAYMNIWSNANQYRPDKGSPWSWLLSIVRYRTLDYLRARQRRTAVMDTSPATVDGLAHTDTSAISEGMLRCLEKLRPAQRDSIVEAFFHGWTYAELAGRLVEPLATVKSRVRRGLTNLKECLEQ